MKRRFGAILGLCGLVLAAIAAAQDATPTSAPAIDLNRARQLMQRQRAGESLSADEREYLNRARALRQQQQGKPGGNAGRAGMAPATQSTGLVPLSQMSAKDRYKGMDGGLYGAGSNVPVPDHQKAIDAAVAQIAPLDAQGHPSPEGKIVLISIGMSNTTQEFSAFKSLADADHAKSPKVVIVDGAQGGQDAAAWASGDAATWQQLSRRLQQAGVTPQQVQTAWIKQAVKNPARFGDWPAHGQELEGQMISLIQVARQRFPNLRVAYLSSRIYAGYANGPLNPEPYAYESGFAVRDLILKQIAGDPALSANPASGEVKSPVLLWGPYLWADGTTPRAGDRLTWERADLGPDGTHPSPASGRAKVANLLLDFM